MNTIQEYLVKLGVQLDERNMAKLINFLESGKVKAAALSGAMIAAGTVIYKFIKATTQAEMSLANLAKQQGKSVEQTRAQQNALKAMNATAQDVAKDPALKTIYEDLQKINKEMALPDMKNVLGTVRSLQKEFYALRSTVQYGLQWINYYLLQQLKEPIEQIGKWFKQAREWLRVNMKQVSRDIATYMSAFGKGLVGILDTAKRIFEWVGRLPDGVKAIGAAVIGLTALIKSGPLGQLLMLVEAIGGLYQDYDNYKANLANPGKAQVEIAFPSIWEALESDLSAPEKTKSIIELITGKISDVAGNLGENVLAWVTQNKDDIVEVGSTITTLMTEGIKGTGEILRALLGAFTSVTGDPEFQHGLAEMIRTALRTAFSTLNDVGSMLVNTIAQAISGKTEAEWAAEFPGDENNPFLGALGAALIAKIFGADQKGQIITGLATLFGSQFTDEEVAATLPEDGESGIYGGLKSAVEKLWAGFKGFLETRFDVISDFVNVIGPALTGVTQADWEKALGENNTIMDGLVVALFAKLSGMSTKDSIVSGIVGSITDAFVQKDGSVSGALSKVTGDLMSVGKVIWDEIEKGFGAFTEWWDSEDGKNFRKDVDDAGKGIAKALFGAEDEDGNRTGGLWDSFVEILSSITKAVTESELWQTITDKIKDAVRTAAESLWGLISPYITDLWSNIVSHMPKWLKDVLQIGEVTTVKHNDDGTVTMASTNGNETTITEHENKEGRTMSGVLADNADILEITQNGFNVSGSSVVGVMGEKIDEIVNGKIQEAIAAGAIGYLDTLLDLYRNLTEENTKENNDALAKHIGSSIIPDTIPSEEPQPHGRRTPSPDEEEEELSLTDVVPGFGDISNTVTEQFEQGIENVDAKVEAEVDGKKLVDSAKRAFNRETILVRTKAVGNNAVMMSSGGRIGSRRDDVTVGEDGTEYIIPITKPGRAVQLITQMLGEMGRGVTGQILNAIGIGSDLSSVSNSMTNYADMLSGKGSTVNYYNNVTAPVTISVQAAASSAAETGMYLYNLTQRSLLRSVQGVLAS